MQEDLTVERLQFAFSFSASVLTGSYRRINETRLGFSSDVLHYGRNYQILLDNFHTSF